MASRRLFDGAQQELGLLPIVAASSPPPAGITTWLRVAGVWTQATVWINVAGTWKVSTPFIKISGSWR